MDVEDLSHRFRHHPPSPEKAMRHTETRTRCLELAFYINENIPEGREKSLAMTHLEETLMWCNAGIARHE